MFLHADSRLGDDAHAAIARHVRGKERSAGYLGLAFRHDHFFYRLLERGQRARVRELGLIYGDQGLLIPRDLFFTAGPYPDQPLMEDVNLNRRLHSGGLLRPLPATLTTSARRYEEEGRVRAWLRNVHLITRLLSGDDPASLTAAYPPRTRPKKPDELAPIRDGSTPANPHPTPPAPNAALLVFAKAPRPGAVKTRLARSIGDRAAAEVYRRMGRLIIEQVAPAPATVTVCHDPDDAGKEVRDWLGSAPARYWPQGGGDLGARLSRMFDRAFESSERVGVIGTDAPAVDAETVRRALLALDSADLVLGPSRDGGYYLMALRRPQPHLFTGIGWSTPSVMEETVARARSLGLSVTCLEVQSDVDTAADLTPEVAGRLGREV